MLSFKKVVNYMLANRRIGRLEYFNPHFERIARFKDCHKGKRGFIIGSGPSLKIEDLDLLKNEITFACNKIYLAFDKTSWRPSYYSVVDSMVAGNNARKINKYDLVKIFSNSVRCNFIGKKDIYWLRDIGSTKINNQLQFSFSTDLTEGANGGYTVIYTMLQLAYYMGLQEVYLLGLDFSFEIPEPSTKKSPIGETLLYGKGEVNHFHPEYRSKGEAWTMPRLDLQYQAFNCAKSAFEADGRVIYNASRQTRLDVFPRVTLQDVLGNTQNNEYANN